MEIVTQKLEKQAGGASSDAGSAEVVAPQVIALDQYNKTHIENFLNLSRKINNELNKAADMVVKAVEEHRKIIVMSTKCKKPDVAKLTQIIDPVLKAVKALDDYRFKEFKSKLYNHLYGIAEGLKCLNWVGIEGVCVPFIESNVEASQFYTNKVLREFKAVDPVHAEWVKSLTNLIQQLCEYVKENYKTGLSWNPKGMTTDEFIASGGAAAKATPAAAVPAVPAAPKAPMPPMAPPAPAATSAPAASKPAPAGTADIFSQIQNLGEGGLKLKHVTADMKAKNRPEKVSGVVPDVIEKKTKKEETHEVKKMKGTPKFCLEEDKKWCVDFQEGKMDLEIDGQINHACYIFHCKDILLRIKGKLNSVTIDSCEKVRVVFDSLVSTFEVVNSKKTQIQMNDYCPTILIDKCFGCEIYVQTEKGLETSILSSNSNEMNIVPPEHISETVPLPEQYQSVWDKTKKTFITTAVSHLGV